MVGRSQNDLIRQSTIPTSPHMLPVVAQALTCDINCHHLAVRVIQQERKAIRREFNTINPITLTASPSVHI